MTAVVTYNRSSARGDLARCLHSVADLAAAETA